MTKVLKCAYMHLLLKCEAIIVTEEKIRPNIKIHWPQSLCFWENPLWISFDLKIIKDILIYKTGPKNCTEEKYFFEQRYF